MDRVKKILIQFALPIIGAGVILYFFLTPVITSSLFPEYQVKRSYVDIKACSDTTIQQASSFFLPQTCESLAGSASLGCVSMAAGYIAPISSTTDQQIVCPTLEPARIEGQTPNPALPVFRVQEYVYQLGVTIICTIIVGGMYVTTRFIISRFIRRKYSQSEVLDQQTDL
ncbi:hypothetical protein H7200_02745 [Candidatus Saccharibacteria bacterium]|nr:hypothetical protein [Candidatus Saccharibacteria bacterium]